jgi:hypothetical protein
MMLIRALSLSLYFKLLRSSKTQGAPQVFTAASRLPFESEITTGLLKEVLNAAVINYIYDSTRCGRTGSKAQVAPCTRNGYELTRKPPSAEHHLKE